MVKVLKKIGLLCTKMWSTSYWHRRVENKGFHDDDAEYLHFTSRQDTAYRNSMTQNIRNTVALIEALSKGRLQISVTTILEGYLRDHTFAQVLEYF